MAPELDGLLGWVACSADAQSGDGRIAVDREERYGPAVQELVSQVQSKPLAAEVAAELGELSVSRDDLETGKHLVRLAGDAVASGVLGYALLLAGTAARS